MLTKVLESDDVAVTAAAVTRMKSLLEGSEIGDEVPFRVGFIVNK